MIGKYDITLYNNKVHYHLTVERNITVLRGDSASGKSEFVRLLSAHNSNPTSSGITLICDKRCSVLTEENWELFTDTYTDSIFFIDEGNGFLKTKKFAETVKGADNYFVIITREKLSQLPYSIDEIYGLREDADPGRYHNPKRVYNGMYRIFGKLPEPDTLPDLIITEDSNSGNDFFRILFPDRCISSKGKSNIKKVIERHSGQKIMAVVDGAAFGPEMQDCMDISTSTDGTVALYAPESFEYLILRESIRIYVIEQLMAPSGPGCLTVSDGASGGGWLCETNRKPYKNVPYNKKACVLWVGVGAPPRESMVRHHHTIQTRAMTHF